MVSPSRPRRARAAGAGTKSSTAVFASNRTWGRATPVDIVLDRDDEPRSIEAPEDLQAALVAVSAALERWERMSHSHRKHYVTWIEDAKRAATRARRVEPAVPMIVEGARRT